MKYQILLRATAGVFLVFLLKAVAAQTSWQQTPYEQWTIADVQDVLSKSPWALRSRERIGSPPFPGGITFDSGSVTVRLRSAMPIRQALVRLRQIIAKYDEMSASEKAGFDTKTKALLEPIWPNENVLIEMFVSGGRRVKVSILEHKSEAEAIETMKRGAADKSAKALLKLGDEAYSWGFSDAIAFRKGNLTVSVSAFSDIDALLPLLDPDERTSLRRSEEVAVNKGLARTIANILSALDQACQPMERV